MGGSTRIADSSRAVAGRALAHPQCSNHGTLLPEALDLALVRREQLRHDVSVEGIRRIGLALTCAIQHGAGQTEDLKLTVGQAVEVRAEVGHRLLAEHLGDVEGEMVDQDSEVASEGGVEGRLEGFEVALVRNPWLRRGTGPPYRSG